MPYLKFNKSSLVNLEYSLKREIIITNRTGAYANTTLVGCNTRKYHCLLAVPIEQMNWRRHALLSSLDETLIQNGKSFNLGIHCYGDIFEPRGHKYIVDYQNDPVPTVVYNVGGIKFQKSILMVQDEDRVMIAYTLLDAHSETTLRLKPFLSFRSIHSLTKCNIEADTHYIDIDNGKAFKLYRDLPYLNMQLSKKADYYASPDWYYGITYPEEMRRGFDCTEDLFVPGFFEMPIKKGETIIFSASTKAFAPQGFKRKFTSEMRSFGENSDFDSTLKNAAKRLFVNRSGRLEICTGFSWLGVGQLRDTFVCAAGLTLHNNGDVKAFLKVIDDVLGKWEEDLYTSSIQVEAPLRLAVVMQEYIAFTKDAKGIWNRYGKVLKEIIKSYMDGRPEVQMHDNGLLWASMPGIALSWMNTYIDGRPINERAGYQVETNALWYNALRFAAEMEKNKSLVNLYTQTADKIQSVFYKMFWVESRQHLADYIGHAGQNIFTRPNQLYACGLKYSPIDDESQAKVLKAVRRELVTIKGIRTLSPKNPLYRGVYEGNQKERDTASHNGCTRAWLLGIYASAGFKLYGKAFLHEAEQLISTYEDDMTGHGIGTLAEIYDGDPPHNPHGAISSATSISSIFSIKSFINHYKEGDK